MKQTSLYAKIVVTVFLVLLFAMTLISVFIPDKDYSEREKRPLQTMPSFTLDSLLTRNQSMKFTQKYEDYVADQFLLRNSFVSLKNNAELMLGKRDMNGIYIGNEGYLFSKETEYDNARLQANLSAVSTFINNASNAADLENIAVTLVPDSSHILTEKLPSHASVYDYDKLQETASLALKDAYVSIKDNLVSHKEEDIYYKTDHHWTTLGAFYGYQSIAAKLGFSANDLSDYDSQIVSDHFIGTYASKVNLELTGDSITRYDSKTGKVQSVELDDKKFDSIYDENALQTADQYNYFLYGNYPLTKITTSTENGRTLLVIKDSYAHSIIPFLCDHYETILCVDLRHFRESTLKLCEDENVTDLLILYQATNFCKDSSLIQLNLA